ncbi:hypothetical protein J6590_032073 [Homalodisca vitripennis]|nr:hypothetical protein J6590_032073 [Homalodisca vitripennis]
MEMMTLPKHTFSHSLKFSRTTAVLKASEKFNLGCHVPKKDRCDLCEKYLVAEKTDSMEDNLKREYERHQVLKTEMRETRAEEKKQQSIPTLLFDYRT